MYLFGWVLNYLYEYLFHLFNLYLLCYKTRSCFFVTWMFFCVFVCILYTGIACCHFVTLSLLARWKIIFPCGRGCDLNYFRISITNRTTTTSVFICILSTFPFMSLHVVYLMHFGTFSQGTQRDKALWWAFLCRRLMVVLNCVCEDLHVIGGCLQSCFTHRPCLP